jgi:CheY-like chemotaxis protein
MAKLVLIVEDSETCAETLLIALESMPGVELRVIHSPRAAIEAMWDTGNEVAAIVTDLNLGGPHHPQSDGFELIRKLRAEPRFARLPILLISGDSDPQLPERALAQGADAFFPKPYSPSAVRKKLEQLLC